MAQHKILASVALALASMWPAFGQSAPPPEAFKILPAPADGPQITPYLQYQTELAWRQDAARREEWSGLKTEQDLLHLQNELREKILIMMGGLPAKRTPLNARVTGNIPMHGFHIEKLIFESLPKIYVTALLYVPEDGNAKHPAILVPAGHAPDGKAHYQVLCQRLARRGYLVIAWDPVGQGERSQFWDVKAHRSRYNLICAEHAVLGNLAYLAGANLARWEIWDGLRAFDYLLTRPEVDPERINITGTSGGGFQAMHIAALEPRIKVAAVSCYITSLPMRMYNRIFKDPDSDPEQDLYGMISNGVDNAGLMLMMYPRPIFVAAAVLDFFPIEGTRQTFREIENIYERFGHGDRIGMAEGYHGHQYSDENQEAAFEFLDHFNDLPPRQSLAIAKELDGNKLQCTRSGQEMLDFEDARSLMDEIRDYYSEQRATTVISLKQLYFGSGYPEIRKWSVVKYGGGIPADNQIAWENVGSSQFGDTSIDRYALHCGRHLVMPLLHIHHTNNSGHKWMLWVDSNGKASADNWPAIRKYLDDGFDIVTFDLRGLGETRMRYTAISEDDPSLAQLDFDHAYVNPLSSVLADYVYNSLLIGRPYFLQMIEDAEIAQRFAQSQLQAQKLFIASDEKDSQLTAAIAATLPEVKLFAQSEHSNLKWSDLVLEKREQWPIQYLMPEGAYIQ